MTATNTQCPTDAVLSDFGLGKLDATSADSVSQHIETCADCRRRVASLSGDSFVGRLRQAGGAAPPVKRERTYVPGESLANAASSTDGASVKEDALPGPSRSSDDLTRRDRPGGPSSVTAPPELMNHPDYELIKELGQGGMGTVYLAKNRMMDRPEVLKVISKSLLDRPGALERFQQEIRSAAKLAHPNIVAAYSVLRPGELLVFAMEYVRGQDLAEVVKQRGALPIANAAFYIHQVANGLQHALEKGMVHRDIKPNNLMLAIEGKKHVVKILDFGLAKASSEKGAEFGLTKSGQMLGTPDYVAPEQTLDAHKADIRADIYSLGCTLYFLLSGGPPFQEASLFEILKAHHERDPKPLNLVRSDVPVELAAVVAKMMAKQAARRYQTPNEVAKALVPFFKPGQSDAREPTKVGQTKPAAETQHGASSATPPCLPMPVLAVPPPVPVVRGVPPATARFEDFSASMDAQRITPSRCGWWSSRPPWQKMTAILAASSAAVLLLGIVFFVKKGNHVIGRARLPSPVASAEPQDDLAPPKETSVVPRPDLGRSGYRAPVAVAPSDANQARAPNLPSPLPSVEPQEGSDLAPSEEPSAVRPPDLGTGNQPPVAVAPSDAGQARAHQEGDPPSEAATGSDDDGDDVSLKSPDTDEVRSSDAPLHLPKGSGRSKPTAPPKTKGDDAGPRFRPGSVWAGSTPWGKATLTVTWRKGNSFRARYRNPTVDWAMSGTIKGSEVQWFAKDYRNVKAPNKGTGGKGHVAVQSVKPALRRLAFSDKAAAWMPLSNSDKLSATAAST